MQGLVNFIKYNNTVPIVLGVIFLGSGAAFAASDPQAVYSQQQQVVSVDNTYIANKDLTTWTPQVRITGVTEDANNYYVAYDLSTIDVVDYVWRDATKSEVMTVNKADLGVRDLGVYVTGQFRNVIGNELSYLRDVQDKAKNDLSQKVVATTYGGLVGKFLDSKTETLPGYTPVVTPSLGNDGHDQVAAADGGTQGSGASPVSSSGANGGASNLMSLQVLGANPARVAVGSGYIDLGVVLIDPTNPNIGYHAFVDGTPNDPPSVDTSTTSVRTIEYRATDQAGNQLMVRRVVIVGDAPDLGTEINTAGNVPTGPMPAAVVSQPVVASTTSATSTPPATTSASSQPAPDTNTASSTTPAPAPADTTTQTTTTATASTTPAPSTTAAATTTSNEASTTTQ